MSEVPPAFSGMVTAPHYLASAAGRDVLADGGTAVEAAVAVASTLASVYPHMTGIGGDAFWVIAEPDGKVHSVEGCGRAAASADLSLYAGKREIPWRGPLAANTVAGAISSWEAALASDDGALPLSRLLRDAIHYARTGVPVTAGGAKIATGKGAELRNLPGAYAATFEPEGRPLSEGDSLRQPVLAETFERLVEAGLADFYSGDLAADIASDLKALGSPLSGDDLAAHQAIRPEPLFYDGRYGRLFNSAPPTQGFASLLILALFERLVPGAADGFDHVHRLVEATKQAFLLRDAHIGDPAYMDFDPQALLSNQDAIDALAEKIDVKRALPWPQVPAFGDTCWFAAADSRGQVVSAIQSTYFEFGSGLVLPKTGIVWQNRGSSFRLAERGWNALMPGRKPFHTLNPALAKLSDGRTIAYGTMGGEGQPQTQAAIFTRHVSYDVPLQDAVSAPRWLLGRTWGETSTSLKLEDRFPPDTLAALSEAGHDVELLPDFSEVMGHAGAIVRYRDGRMDGATDPRSDGAVSTC